jgi:hypothetical protein
MLPPHPQESEVHDNGIVTENWREWFRQTRDHTNRGETPLAIQDVVASTGIQLPGQITNVIVRVQGSTTANSDVTQIEAGYDGQVITVVGQDDTKTITLKSGGNIRLAGAADLILKKNYSGAFHYDASQSLWIETNRVTT